MLRLLIVLDRRLDHAHHPRQICSYVTSVLNHRRILFDQVVSKPFVLANVRCIQAKLVDCADQDAGRCAVYQISDQPMKKRKATLWD